jgi:hypothetical protein
MTLSIEVAFAQGMFTKFKNEINNSCESVDLNNLLIKKSLIEYIRTESCEGNFVKSIINKCPELECRSFIQAY